MTHNTDAYTIAGHLVQFIDWRTRTRYGTAEHSELFVDGSCTAEGRYRWTNRPWQVFDFQCSREDAASEAVRAQQASRKSEWMERNGYARMTAKRCKEWAAIETAPKTHSADSAYGFALAVWCVANCGGRTWGGLDDYARAVLARLDHVDEMHDDGHSVAYLFASTPDDDGAITSFTWSPSYSTITH